MRNTAVELPEQKPPVKIEQITRLDQILPPNQIPARMFWDILFSAVNSKKDFKPVLDKKVKEVYKTRTLSPKQKLLLLLTAVSTMVPLLAACAPTESSNDTTETFKPSVVTTIAPTQSKTDKVVETTKAPVTTTAPKTTPKATTIGVGEATKNPTAKATQTEAPKSFVPNNKNVKVDKSEFEGQPEKTTYKVKVVGMEDIYVSQQNLDSKVKDVIKNKADLYKEYTCLAAAISMIMGFFHPEMHLSNDQLQLMIYDGKLLNEKFPEVKDLEGVNECGPNSIYSKVVMNASNNCQSGGQESSAIKFLNKIKLLTKLYQDELKKLSNDTERKNEAYKIIKDSIDRGYPALFTYVYSPDYKPVAHAVIVTGYFMDAKGNIQYLLVKDPALQSSGETALDMSDQIYSARAVITFVANKLPTQ